MCIGVEQLKKNAFTLVEVLLSLAIVGVVASGFMSMLAALDRKAQEIEINSVNQGIALEVINDIRRKRLKNWEDLAQKFDGSSGEVYKISNIDMTSGGGGVSIGSDLNFGVSSGVSVQGQKELSESLKGFCSDNRSACYPYGNFRLNQNNNVFNVVLEAEELSEDAFLINIYVGTRADSAPDSFTKLTTIISEP